MWPIDKIIPELTLEEKAKLCSGADFWHTQALERFGVPRVMMCDGPHGLRKQIGEGDHLGINVSIPAVCFPTGSALAASFDRDLVSSLGQTLGSECRDEGVGMLLGPGCNIKRSPLCGRNFEYLSEDPYQSSEIASAFIQGLQSQGVAACPKHFAANNQETLRMTSNSVVDDRTLHEIYLASFEGVVKKSAPESIMCAYNQVNGTYLAENQDLLTHVLREKWGFSGFVVTDWGAVKDRVTGLQAGLDLEMPGGSSFNAGAIIKAVQSGALDERTLDQTVERILAFAARHAQSGTSSSFDRASDLQKAIDVARQCAVLLKNDNNVLPLAENARVALIGEFAESPRYQGSGSSFINSARVISAVEAASGLPNICYVRGYQTEMDTDSDELLAEAVQVADDVDAAIIFAGLPDSYESEGFDRTHLDIPANQIRLIESVSRVQPNTIVVLHNGAPVVMPWADQVQAILEMYLGGDGVGAASIDILFGRANPCGRLAETFPIRLADTPAYLNFPGEKGRVDYREGIFIGYRYYDKKDLDVLFPFGHGLSYTQFEYSNLRLDRSDMTDQDNLLVQVDIRNAGSRRGSEVVQLYVRDLQSSVGRPVRELKGFEKVLLQPGEVQTVQFVLDKRAFAYYEIAIQDWHVESGAYNIDIGASSRDIRLTGQVDVSSTRELPIIFHKYSTMGEILATSRGQQILGRMMAARQTSSDVGSALGSKSQEAVQAMAMQMPLASLATFGQVSPEQLEGLLAALNGSAG